MSMYLKRLMMKHRLMAAAGDEGGGGGSGQGGEGGDGEGDGHEGADGQGGQGGSDDDDGQGKGTDDSKKPKVSDTEAKLLKEVMTKKTALEAARSELKKFEGIDPEKARAALAAQQEAERKQLEARGDWDRLKEQMVTSHTAEKATLQAKIDEYTAELARASATIAELTVGGAFAQSAFIKDEVSLTPNKARAVYGAHFEFVDGQIVGFDKPAGAANRTQLIGADGNPLAFEDALRKLVDADPDRDAILRSKMKPGAGSRTNPNAKPFKQTDDAG